MLAEALAGGPDPSEVAVTRETLTAQLGSKRQSIRLSTVGTTRYLDVGWTE